MKFQDIWPDELDGLPALARQVGEHLTVRPNFLGQAVMADTQNQVITIGSPDAIRALLAKEEIS